MATQDQQRGRTQRREQTMVPDDNVVEYGACRVCGYRMLPVLPMSPCGHPNEPARSPLDAVGTVYSWSRVWSRDGDATVMVMVDFFDGALRVTAPLLDAYQVDIGQPVRITAGLDTPYAFRAVA